MKPVCFSICREIVTHRDQRTVVELRIEKAFMAMPRLDKSMCRAILPSRHMTRRFSVYKTSIRRHDVV